MIRFDAKELRTATPTNKALQKIKKNPIYIILDDVLDTYNVGAIFRLADAVAAKKVILCGQTETPPNTRIKKASINTTEWVAWSYAPIAVGALQELKIKNDPFGKTQAVRGSEEPSGSRRGHPEQGRMDEKLKIIAIEQNPKSIPYDQVNYTFPIALVVGNETNGISKEVLDICDQIVELPMWGVNKSLNVMVSLGIVLYEAMKQPH